MSYYSSLESQIPDSVRTLGHLESIEEEEEIYPKIIDDSTLAIPDNSNVKEAPKNTLDKEKTMYFRSDILTDSADHLTKLTDSFESKSYGQKEHERGYKIIGIDEDQDSDEEPESLEEYRSDVSALERSDFIESLNEITTKSDKLSISTPNDQTKQEKHKKSKWTLFFKNAKTKISKVKNNDAKRTFSVPQISKKKFFRKLLPHGKSFVAPSNEKKSITSEEKRTKSVSAREKEIEKNCSKAIKLETERFEREYQILNQIGSGGHSVVNLAIRKSDNKKVVAKTIQCVSVWHWHTDQETGEDDLPLEVHMLQKFDKLNYPGIIKYYDHFDLATKFVIIMEYLGQDWMDLYDYIEHFGPVREKDASEIFSRVVSIVCNLHKAGYCHNDIKDENIMINARTRQIKLIDFGSLTYLSSGVTHNTFYGTRKFQSPEAIKGTYLLEFQEVWALGTLYYVMLFKMDPFKNDSEVLEVDIKRRMDRIRHFGVDGMIIDISDEAVLSISKMLNRDWTKRPTVSEILSLPAFKKQ